jgi:taurine dioxygenase
MVGPLHVIEIVGMDRAEGDPLLEELVAHVTDGRFTYIHDWELDDMVLWDNWRTHHMAFGASPDYDRTVQRTSIRGLHDMGRVL